MQHFTLKTKNMMLLGVSTLLFALTTSSQAQTFYKWVDKNGSTHYTLTPPPNNAQKVAKVPTYSDQSSSTSTTPQTSTEAANTPQDGQPQQQAHTPQVQNSNN